MYDNQNTYESSWYKEQIEMVLWEGEHRHADVWKYEIFRKEIEQFKYLLGPDPWIVRQIVISVMCLTNATEQHRHDS